jgi:hypothetical protein
LTPITPRLGVFGIRSGLVGAGGTTPGAFSGGQLDRMAAVYFDAPSAQAKEEIIRLVLSAQNGVNTFSRSAPDCFVGDTAIEVSLSLAPDKQLVVLDLTARLHPSHLTWAFVFRNLLPRQDARAFLAAFEQARDYVLTVALNGALDLKALYVVKYHVFGRV